MDENPYRGSIAPGGMGKVSGPGGCRPTFLKTAAVVGAILLFIALLLPAQRSAQEPARRSQCMNKLKQIAYGLKSYHDMYHRFPPAYAVDADGKPLHSWRTLILPFVEENELYRSIDLSKPWDDPVNAAACGKMVDAYDCPSTSNLDNRTNYLAIVTPDSCLQPGQSHKMSDIQDGSSKTLMLIEVDADHEVPWMAPLDADEELIRSLGQPGSKLAHSGNVVIAVAADASVHSLAMPMPAETLHALITIAGQEQIVIPDPD